MTTVEFPGLWGLKLTVDRVAFRVFGIPIYWYGIIIAAGFLLSFILAVKNSRKFGFNPDVIMDLVLFGTPSAIIAARLYYVIFSWEDFRNDPLLVFDIRGGGLAIYGGIIGAIAAGLIYCRAKKINTLSLFDFAVPYLVLGQAIGRWGNFVNQEAFGSNTLLPWGMTSETVRSYLERNMEELAGIGIIVNPDIPVHPTFLYESLWNLGVFLFLIWYRKRKKLDGEVLMLYFILYGAGRFWIEGLRTDSLMLGSFRVSQLLSGLLVVIMAAFFIYRRRKTYQEQMKSE